MLVAYRCRGRSVFLYGFAKNEKESLTRDELVSLQEIAAAWLSADRARIMSALKAGELQEITDGKTGNEPPDKGDSRNG